MSINEMTKKYNIKVYVVEQLCRANEKYDALDIYGKDVLYETIMDSIVRNFSLN